MASLNLSWITEDLAIGGCFDREHVIDLVRDHRVAGVIDLRDDDGDDADELARHGIALLHMPTLDLSPIGDEGLELGVEFARRLRGRRLLVHCIHGIGRSALLALCILVDRGHSPSDAIALAKLRRPCVSPSPAQYAAWATWLAARGVRTPSFDEFASVMYRPKHAIGA